MAAQVEKAMNGLKVDDKTPTKTTSSTATKPNPSASEPQDPGSSDDDEDAAVPNGDASAPGDGTQKKKKKKKPKKKKKASGGSAPTATAQSDPPRIPLAQLFPNNTYPVTDEVPYNSENSYRTTSEEKRHLDRLQYGDFINEYRHAAEVHRQVRAHAQRSTKPGQTLTEIAENIEDGVRALTGHDGLSEGDCLVAGMGFPCGLSINNCAAHYTPNAGNKVVLQQDDVVKVDFGSHVNGRIVDSAFTLAFQDHYQPLLDAARAATNAGIAAAGIDVRVADIGAAVQEVMESYEVELPTPAGANSSAQLKNSGQHVGTQTFPVKCVRNLNGHNIEQFRIHGGKSVPIVRNAGDNATRMEEGEIFAIETFGSTGRGYVADDLECSHYSRVPEARAPLRVESAKRLLRSIDRNFGTLPWCRRYLDRLGNEKYLLGLNELVRSGLVTDYPPLCDVKGSYTAQFEHTFVLRPNCKEVVSRGDDY